MAVRGFVRCSLAVLFAAASACRGRDESAAAPVRLLEQGPEIVVERGGAAREFPAKREAPLDTSSPLAASALRATPNGYERRAAWVVGPGTRLVWNRHVDGPAVLRVGLAALPPVAGSTARTRFSVAAGPAAGALAPLCELELDSAEPGWRELELPLPRAGFERVELAVDAEGSALAAWALPEVVPARPPAASGRRPNLILLSLDTLRADRLGAYGYSAHPTSPYLDRFAAGAIRFETVIAQAPWTRPSHRAMLSGVYPASRGGLEPVALASVLWNAGYRTSALTAGGQVDARFGFDRGFERYAVERDWLREPERALEALDRDRDRPFFLFLHTYETHDPYEDPRFLSAGACPDLHGRFSHREHAALERRVDAETRACVSALYDGDIAFADEHVGRLLELLGAGGWLDDTIVVVTSDHGEQLWEHGAWEHGRTLFDEALHVPLLLSLPERVRARFARRSPARRAGATISEPVALVDLAPSLYELLGLPFAHAVHGRSFVPLLEGARGEPRELLSENTMTRNRELKSLRTPTFKFIVTSLKRTGLPIRSNPYMLFDLRRDPFEQTDLASSYPDKVRELADHLRALTRGGLGVLDESVPKELEDEFVEELRALGYVDGD